MKGTTNALVLQGGDGGETVFAVNNTGTTIVRGTKAWLNRHNLDENTAYQHYAGGSSTQYAPVFDADNNFWVVNLSGTGRKQFTYDAETKAWTASDLNAGPSGRNFVRFIGGEVIAYASNYAGNATALYSSAVTKDAYTNYAGLYLGSGNVLKWVAAGSFTLANSLGEFPLTGFSGYLYSALMLDGKMFVADGEGNYKFYDFDKFFGTPREIGSGNSTLVKDNYPVMFATGLEAGDYFICNRGSKQNNYEPTELAIFKIGENYALEEADDLQTDLQALTGQVCSVQYNNDTKLLTAGSHTAVYAFKWDAAAKAFDNLNIGIAVPAEGVIADDGAYCLALSEDLTSAVIGYRKRTETLVYWNMGIYKLTTSSNDWYADTFGMASSLSLTGFATGATDEAGRYEFKTATKA